MNDAKKYNIRPSRQLGQNFLINRGIVEKIIASAELSKNDTVLEVGPGKGALTEELVKRAGRVIAVEKDKRLYEMLREKFKGADNLELVNDDILKFSIPNFQFSKKFQVPSSKFQDFKLVANIPYNITGQFFNKFLLAEHRPQIIVVMAQKEVGERLLGKNKSILSLAAALYGRAEKICDVSPGSFFPPPKVTSSVIKLVNRTCHPERGQSPSRSISWGMEQKTLHLAKIGFASRRKKLVSNLSTGLKISKEKLIGIFSEIGLGANVRAEELSMDNWLKLAKSL